MQRTALVAMLLMAAPLVCAQPVETSKAAPSGEKPPFDGTWVVTLVCEDFKPEAGPVAKGYTFRFPVTISEGVLDGQYGKPGGAGSVRFLGRVQPDGSAQIQANGLTGNPDYSVNRAVSSTPYSYRMKGRFEGDRGAATRIDLRPCQAHFSRM